jgi:uncharacterized protein (DUF58 family)
MNLLRGLTLSSKFFYACAIITVLLVLSYPFPALLSVALTALVLFGFITLIDLGQIFSGIVTLDVQREPGSVLSLGDENPIKITITNKSPLKLWLE